MPCRAGGKPGLIPKREPLCPVTSGARKLVPSGKMPAIWKAISCSGPIPAIPLCYGNSRTLRPCCMHGAILTCCFIPVRPWSVHAAARAVGWPKAQPWHGSSRPAALPWFRAWLAALTGRRTRLHWRKRVLPSRCSGRAWTSSIPGNAQHCTALCATKGLCSVNFLPARCRRGHSSPSATGSSAAFLWPWSWEKRRSKAAVWSRPKLRWNRTVLFLPCFLSLKPR